ncbi:zinc ribbon domain-containing protein [Microtetraspora sp. NBRC 16547]|uniref:FmdB family zinc ribbon protein n=1 Tax=Microtetraspora sp. NBRC 16547 TaxID=3030993 RepID=UPI0024A059E1|nr:zinc ribbon domain-containing protein [Microtetraspora sp. NBRC 16547]GLX01601.1 hypothetical protein Misp02_56870 [Microtetraspora sp. NBRC 16547]
MAIYEYLCPDCGPFDVSLPMGTAPETGACSACEGPARRRFSGPNLRRVHPALAAGLAGEERSREAPEVVRAPRGGTGPAAARPPHPAPAHLPRP